MIGMIIWPICSRHIEPQYLVPPISPQIVCFLGGRIEPPMDLVFGSAVFEMVGTVSMNLSVGFKRKWQHHMPWFKKM